MCHPSRQLMTSRFTLDRIIRFVFFAGVVGFVVWLLWFFSVLYYLQALSNREIRINIGQPIS